MYIAKRIIEQTDLKSIYEVKDLQIGSVGGRRSRRAWTEKGGNRSAADIFPMAQVMAGEMRSDTTTPLLAALIHPHFQPLPLPTLAFQYPSLLRPAHVLHLYRSKGVNSVFAVLPSWYLYILETVWDVNPGRRSQNREADYVICRGEAGVAIREGVLRGQLGVGVGEHKVVGERTWSRLVRYLGSPIICSPSLAQHWRSGSQATPYRILLPFVHSSHPRVQLDGERGGQLSSCITVRGGRRNRGHGKVQEGALSVVGLSELKNRSGAVSRSSIQRTVLGRRTEA